MERISSLQVVAKISSRKISFLIEQAVQVNGNWVVFFVYLQTVKGIENEGKRIFDVSFFGERIH